MTQDTNIKEAKKYPRDNIKVSLKIFWKGELPISKRKCVLGASLNENDYGTVFCILLDGNPFVYEKVITYHLKEEELNIALYLIAGTLTDSAELVNAILSGVEEILQADEATEKAVRERLQYDTAGNFLH